MERGYPGTEFCVDIVVKGRKTEVPERFRKHVAEKLKLEKIQKLDGKVISLDVEVSKEPNPRQADRSDRVEITLHSRGPVIRAEAAASDAYAALDLAADKLEARLRKQHDKRYTRRGNGRISAAEVADVVPGAATLNGSGDLYLKAYDQPDLVLEINGSGRVEAQGKTRKVDLKVSGSGEADLRSLDTGDAKVALAGSGEAHLAPHGAAEVEVAGSGDVYLTSKPTVLSSNVAGSGEVHQDW